MKITSIGHASILIEAGGVTVLSDPWWRGPCFGAQWWAYPSPSVSSLEGKQVDYIYVSHGHHDHFHPGTLGTLSRSATVLVSSRIGLASSISALGFRVIELDNEQTFPLGSSGVHCRIMETHADDTLMALTDGREACVNLNDSLHSAPEAIQRKFVAELQHLFPQIDYLYCGYGVASHFPNCYIIPGKDRETTAAHRQRYFNRQWATLVEALRPKYAVPFAADVVFLEEDLFWVNEPLHNSERPTETFRALYPHSPVTTIDAAPGFTFANGRVESAVIRTPLDPGTLRSTYSDQIVRANEYGPAHRVAIEEVADLVRSSLSICSTYLCSFLGDYRFLIRLRNSDLGIEIQKNGSVFNVSTVRAKASDIAGYDLAYTTRIAYLRRSLTTLLGNEILFVGSGGIFEYRDRADVRRKLHLELKYMITMHDQPHAARQSTSPRFTTKAKQTIKRLLGQKELDLYDLEAWTAFGVPNS